MARHGVSATPSPMTLRSSPEPLPQQDEKVPLFGTWRAIHASVVLCALVVMGLLALFSRWPF